MSRYEEFEELQKALKEQTKRYEEGRISLSEFNRRKERICDRMFQIRINAMSSLFDSGFLKSSWRY